MYHSNSGIENWFEEKILSAIFTVLSTMALGFVVVYIIYISAKLSAGQGMVQTAMKNYQKAMFLDITLKLKMER